MKIHHWIVIACGAALVAGTNAAAGQVTSSAASSGLEGLVKVKSKRFDEVHLRPDAEFRGYSKVMLNPTEVTFARNWMKDMNSQRIALLQGTTTKDAERITEEVRAGFDDVLTNAFKRAGYEIVVAPGADVIRLSVNIVDLYINAPASVTMALPSRVYTLDAGAATLALEIRDSTTGALLGRINDRRKAGDRGNFRSSLMVTTPISNRFDFGRLFDIWAWNSVESLTELKAPAPEAVAVPGHLH